MPVCASAHGRYAYVLSESEDMYVGRVPGGGACEYACLWLCMCELGVPVCLMGMYVCV